MSLKLSSWSSPKRSGCERCLLCRLDSVYQPLGLSCCSDKGFGRVRRKVARPKKTTPVTSNTDTRTCCSSKPFNHSTVQLIAKAVQASHLADVGTAPCSRQAISGGPSLG